MKKITYLILSIFITMFCACSEDVGDYAVKGEALTEFAVKAPANNSSLVLNIGAPDETVNFQWGASASGLGSAVMYGLAIDKADGDFSSPLFTAAADGEAKATNLNLSYAKLKEVAEKATLKDGAYDLTWRVGATNASGVKVYTAPASLKITVPAVGVSPIQLKSPEDASILSLNKILAAQEKVIFKWAKATATDGSALKYQFVAAQAGNNFESPIIVSEPTTLDSVAYTTTQLVEKFNAAGITSIDMILEWKVVAIAGTTSFSSASYKAVLNIQDIPFLYMVGGATVAGWSPENGVEMSKVSDGVYSVETKLAPGNGGWKFIAGKEWGKPDWGTIANGDPLGGPLVDGDGENDIPAPATAALYKVTADFTTMTYTVEEVKSAEKIYIIGDVLGGKTWDNSNTDYIMFRANNDVSDRTYTYTGYFKAGGFKCISEKSLGTWDGLYGKGDPGNLSQDGGAGNIDIPAAGYYTVTVNLTAMTYTIENYDASAATTYDRIGLIGSGTPTGWDGDTPMTPTDYDPHIWVLDGIALAKDEVKIRANNSWDVAWGGGESEYGIGTTAPGAPNINITSAGNYYVKFNDLTGHFIFLKK